MVISEFFKKERERMHITLEGLCEGLYTPSMMMRIERGERKADFLYLDRLIGRLGIAGDSCENYLNPEEYKRWENGQLLLEALEEERILEAEERIAHYAEWNGGNVIGRQFCCVMEAEIKEKQGAPEAQIAELYKEAAFLTIPQIEKKSVMELCLSAQEMNIVLEYYRYHRREQFGAVCMELMDKLEHIPYEEVERVKIYPRIAMLLCREKAAGVEQCARYVDKAIEILRNCGKTFYLPELLELQIANLKQADGRLAGELQNTAQELEEYLNVLEEVSRENDVSIRTCSIAYLYRERETYCISDIIRVRRKMLGLSRNELCDGVCSLKTLMRIENRETNAQMYVIKKLFQKLHLPMEIVRLKFLTKEREAYEFMEKVMRQIEIHNYKTAEEMLYQAERYEKGVYIENRQALNRVWVMTKFELGQISADECQKELKKILEYTVPYECIWKADECYLTSEEVMCVQNLATVLPKEQSVKILEKVKRVLEYKQTALKRSKRLALYEVVMSAYASRLGDIGEYDQSNEMSRTIMKTSLECGRISYLEANIYSVLWNQRNRTSGAPWNDEERIHHELWKCFVIARLNNKKEGVQFFREKLI